MHLYRLVITSMLLCLVAASPVVLAESNCGDGIDNDSDGLTDLQDSSCHEARCQDGVDNDLDGFIDGADSDCICMSDVKGWDGQNGEFCTANDVSFVLIGLGIQLDGCMNTDDQVEMYLRAQLQSNATTRYDIGLWVALNGGSALHLQTGNGLCARQILRQAGTATGDCDSDPYNPGPACSVLDGPVSSALPQRDGPFRIEESGAANEPIDRCGDIITEAWNKPKYKYPDAMFDFVAAQGDDRLIGTMIPYRFPCRDLDTSTNGIDGFLTVGTCASWDHQANSICNNFAQAVPGTSSKCRCVDNTTTDIPGPNVRVGCVAGTPPGGVLDPGESVTNQVTVTNDLGTGHTCSPSGTPERFQCGTAGYVRIVVEYDQARGQITGTSVPPGDSVIDDGNRLIWTIKNPAGSDLGVIGPFTGTRTFSYTYELTDTDGTSPAAFSTVSWWSNTLDTSNLGDLTGAVAQSCSGCTCSTNVTTTPVTLASFAAVPDNGDVRFEWTTSTEVGTVGFDLLGKLGGEWVRFNDEPIASLPGDSVEPRDYAVSLQVPDGITEFAIAEYDLNGHATRRGPFTLGRRAGSRVVADEIAWAGIRSGSEERAQRREQRRRSTGRVSAAPVGAVTAGAASAAVPPIELQVDRDGIYRVTFEDLAGAGFDLSKVKADRLGLTVAGEPVPLDVRLADTDKVGTFGPGSSFAFVGHAADTLYTRTNVYRLSLDAHKPARIVVDPSAPSSFVAPAAYTAVRRIEHDRDYAVTSPIEDPWFDTRMVVYSRARSWSFPFEVDGYAPGQGSAHLSVRVYGASTLPEDPDHHVRLSLNGVDLGEYHFDGLDEQVLQVTLPEGSLREGANNLGIRLPADLGVLFDVVNLESFTVTYPRVFVAAGDELGFEAAAPRFEVDGFSGAEVVAYRQGRAGTVRLAGLTVERSERGFRAVLPGDLDGGSTLVVGASAVRTPVISAGRLVADLTGGRADYLVISHPDFLDGIRPLVQERQADGLKVRVVDVEDVYAQYGHGIFGAEAIRDYLADAVPRMGVRYVLLVGGDTYDYRDVLGSGSVSFVPTLYVPTGPTVRFAPSDPALADLDRDGVPEVAIGRLPVRTVHELDMMVQKTLAYQRRDYGESAVFAADSADPAASVSFAAASDRLASLLPRGWSLERAHLDDLTVDNARTAVVGAIDRGVALTSFVGHSGTTSWTFQDLFDVQDAATLANHGRPTVVAQWGCWNTYFVSPKKESLATVLLLSGDQGAAAVLGATTLTEDRAENLLGQELAVRLTQPGTSLGEAMTAAKQALAAQHPDLADVLLGWTLLGDPYLFVGQ